jgi:hypothetical protein
MRTQGKTEGSQRERQREYRVRKKLWQGFSHSLFPHSSLTLPFVFPELLLAPGKREGSQRERQREDKVGKRC